MTEDTPSPFEAEVQNLKTSMADLTAMKELERLSTRFEILANQVPYSRRQLATRAGISLSHVQRIIKGHAHRTTLHNLVRFANACDYDLHLILVPRADPEADTIVDDFVESKLRDRPRRKI